MYRGVRRATPAFAWSVAVLTLVGCAPGDLGTGPLVDSAPGPDDLSALQPGQYHPDRFLVGLGTARATRIRLWRSSLEPVEEWPEIDAAVYEVPPGEDVLDVVRELRRSPRFEYVEPNLACHKLASPNDTWYPLDQWNFQQMGMEFAWDYATGDGVVVAVVDSGLDTAGSDTPVNVLPGINFADTTGSNTNWVDGDGHGTHVSGTIAQATNNAYGVAGIAYDASILPVRVLDDTGSGWQEDIIAGIIWAADNGADVINMSIGYDPYASGSQAEEDACDYAWDAGVFLAAASGNDGETNWVSPPAAYASVVAVGAAGFGGYITDYSNKGPEMELTGFGGDVSVCYHTNDPEDPSCTPTGSWPDGILQETFSRSNPHKPKNWGFYYFDGTSMATPHVSAAAALLFELGKTNAEIRDILTSTATDLGAVGWDSVYGYGLLAAGAAVAACLNNPPVADIGGPYTGEVGTPITFDGSSSSDADGTIVSYEWYFLDGATASGDIVSHAYASVGGWIVVLVVTDDDGASDSTYASVTVAPIDNTLPNPVVDVPEEATVGTELFFDGSASDDPDGSIVTWRWTFGDGGTASTSTATHTYTTPGTYSVALTVTDDLGGSAVAVSSVKIDPLPNLAPNADAGGPYTGAVGVPVAFDGSGSSDPDGTIVSWRWTFGDLSESTEENPGHTYAAAGTYQVVLTVTDDRGDADLSITTATIAP